MSDDNKFLEPGALTNILIGAYDACVKDNAETRAKAGLTESITRKAIGGCCEWCSKLAGTYQYGTEPSDIYRKHDNCTCVLTAKTDKGVSDIWATVQHQSQARKRKLQANQIAKKQRNIQQVASFRKKTYGRAMNIESEADLLKVSRSRIIDMKDTEEIVDYFKREHNIKIIGFDGVDLFGLKTVLAGYDDFISEFPKAGEFIKKITYNTKIRDYGTMNDFGESYVGKKGIQSYGTGIHEAAHALDYYVSKYELPEGQKLSINICKEARKNLKISRNMKKYDYLIFQFAGMTKMSYRGKIKNEEVFAYAIETEMGQGHTNELTKEILRLLKAVR